MKISGRSDWAAGSTRARRGTTGRRRCGWLCWSLSCSLYGVEIHLSRALTPHLLSTFLPSTTLVILSWTSVLIQVAPAHLTPVVCILYCSRGWCAPGCCSPSPSSLSTSSTPRVSPVRPPAPSPPGRSGCWAASPPSSWPHSSHSCCPSSSPPPAPARLVTHSISSFRSLHSILIVQYSAELVGTALQICLQVLAPGKLETRSGCRIRCIQKQCNDRSSRLMKQRRENKLMSCLGGTIHR